MKKYLLPVLIVFTLSLYSCLGIEETITINGDNSGSIVYIYRIAKEIKDLGSFGEMKRSLPLPILEDDFRMICKDKKGLRLASYSSNENEKDIIVRAEVAFSSMAALDALSLPDDPIMKSETSGKGTSLTLVIPAASKTEITDDSLSMVQEISKGYDIVLSVKTPKPITGHTLGDVGSDGRTITYKTSAYDLAKTKQDRLFTIQW